MTRQDGKCQAKVRTRGLGFYRTHLCSRQAVMDGYCKQHHPDTVKAREAKSVENQKARMARISRPFIEMSKLNDARMYLISLGPPGTPLTAAQSARLWRLINF